MFFQLSLVSHQGDIHTVRILVYFVGGKCGDQFFITPILCDANFFDKMSKKITDCDQISINV